MSEKKAYFVLGTEGSGTYFLWNMLQAAGCHAESWHNGIHDDYKFEEMPSPFTIRRSFPHAGQWPDLKKHVYPMVDAGFSVQLLWIIREGNATYQSALRRKSEMQTLGASKLAELEFSKVVIIQEITHFFGFVSPQNFNIVAYEALCLSEGYRRWLFEERLGLTYPEDFEIKYANEKYYEEK